MWRASRGQQWARRGHKRQGQQTQRHRLQETRRLEACLRTQSRAALLAFCARLMATFASARKSDLRLTPCARAAGRAFFFSSERKHFATHTTCCSPGLGCSSAREETTLSRSTGTLVTAASIAWLNHDGKSSANGERKHGKIPACFVRSSRFHAARSYRTGPIKIVIKLTLTLLGDTWIQNAALCVFGGIQCTNISSSRAIIKFI